MPRLLPALRRQIVRNRIHHLCLVLLCIPFALLLLPATAYADDFPVLGVLHTGGHPEALAVDTQTHLLYIGSEYPGMVIAFDPLGGTVRWRAAPGSVSDIQCDSTRHLIYAVAQVNHGNQSMFFVLDGASGHVLAQFPAGSGDSSIAFDTQRQIVYVASKDNSTIFTFTSTGDTTKAGIHIQPGSLHLGSQPEALGVNSQLGRLYVADGKKQTITVFDEQSKHTLASIPVGELPLAPLRIDEASGRIYVVCSTGQELDVIDGRTNRVIARTPVGPYPEGIAIQSATGRIYVANEGDREGGPGSRVHGNTISVLDGQSFQMLGTLAVGQAPDGVEADPVLHRVYVSLEDSGAVIELVDSTDIVLKADAAHQALVARQAVHLLQQATVFIVSAMLLTVVGATLAALLPRWRARENPQIPPADASSRSVRHSLRP